MPERLVSLPAKTPGLPDDAVWRCHADCDHPPLTVDRRRRIHVPEGIRAIHSFSPAGTPEWVLTLLPESAGTGNWRDWHPQEPDRSDA